VSGVAGLEPTSTYIEVVLNLKKACCCAGARRWRRPGACWASWRRSSIRIHGVNTAWVASLGAGLQVPTNIMVNITKNGGVNVFLSVDDAFYEDVELKYVPIYEAIVAIVERFT